MPLKVFKCPPHSGTSDRHVRSFVSLQLPSLEIVAIISKAHFHQSHHATLGLQRQLMSRPFAF